MNNYFTIDEIMNIIKEDTVYINELIENSSDCLEIEKYLPLDIVFENEKPKLKRPWKRCTKDLYENYVRIKNTIIIGAWWKEDSKSYEIEHIYMYEDDWMKFASGGLSICKPPDLIAYIREPNISLNDIDP